MLHDFLDSFKFPGQMWRVYVDMKLRVMKRAVVLGKDTTAVQ